MDHDGTQDLFKFNHFLLTKAIHPSCTASWCKLEQHL